MSVAYESKAGNTDCCAVGWLFIIIAREINLFGLRKKLLLPPLNDDDDGGGVEEGDDEDAAAAVVTVAIVFRFVVSLFFPSAFHFVLVVFTFRAFTMRLNCL